MNTETQHRRIERFEALAEKYWINPALTRSSSDEDTGQVLEQAGDGEGPLLEGPWVAVTRGVAGNGETIYYLYPGYLTREAAAVRATDNVGDDIYEEWPEALVNIDTGESLAADIAVTWR